MGTFLFVIFILGTRGWFAWLLSAHRKSREARERERQRRRMEWRRIHAARTGTPHRRDFQEPRARAHLRDTCEERPRRFLRR